MRRSDVWTRDCTSCIAIQVFVRTERLRIGRGVTAHHKVYANMPRCSHFAHVSREPRQPRNRATFEYEKQTVESSWFGLHGFDFGITKTAAQKFG